MKSRHTIMALVGVQLLVACVAESRFELAPESRLPRWFFNLSDVPRGGRRVRLVYYSTPHGSRATLVLIDDSGTRLAEVEADVGPSRALNSDDPPTGPLPYPRYRIATAQGVSLPPIERHRVGPVAVGADAQKIYELFSADRRESVDLGYEGEVSPALLLRFVGSNQRDGVVAELVAGEKGLTVSRVEIRDPAFRTLKGIGVGSTVGELRAAYPRDSVVSDDNSLYIRVEELSASFTLDESALGSEQLWELRITGVVRDLVKIKSVLLH